MKRTVALLLSIALIFLCSCEDKQKKNNVNYVNNDDYTGIPRVTVGDWFETKPNSTDAVSSSQSESTAVHAVKGDLPDDFPSIPEGTSNVSITKHKKSESTAGYLSDWIELSFSAPVISIIQFSAALNDAGYKGQAKLIDENDVVDGYYPSGWFGGIKTAKNLSESLNLKKKLTAATQSRSILSTASPPFTPSCFNITLNSRVIR